MLPFSENVTYFVPVLYQPDYVCKRDACESDGGNTCQSLSPISLPIFCIAVRVLRILQTCGEITTARFRFLFPVDSGREDDASLLRNAPTWRARHELSSSI
jgi:hypothetical protein